MQNLLKPFKSAEQKAGYVAGLPGYPRNFSRDVLLAGLITKDEDLLVDQLSRSAEHQGQKYDPLTGEEPGKIHHEFPGVAVREPYLTTYNACDTSALYLLALDTLKQLDPERYAGFIDEYQPSIERALEYILAHTQDGIFWEYPPDGATAYSLCATYWKDSIIPCADGKLDPDYPVSYALAHFQNAKGIDSAASLLDRSDLEELADNIFREGIKKFITEDSFCALQDATRRLEQVSSDELHCLAYIPARYSSLLPLRAIEMRSRQLQTAVGIACTPRNISDVLSDTYHGYVVWPFEQALIHQGCVRFGLNNIADIAAKCAPYIDQGYELLHIVPEIKPGGNDRQLWSIAAKIYFGSV